LFEQAPAGALAGAFIYGAPQGVFIRVKLA
jgi:hypothetical protein